MKLSTFSASFHEYEYDLDYYHGKDIVHEGSLLKIDPDYSWNRITSKIRNKIRQAQKLEVDIKKVRGTAQDIQDFRTVWFDPEDETIPKTLDEDEVMYMAYIKGELVGGLILTPSSPTVLYMHNLGSNDSGKRQNIPALLLWNAVQDLHGTRWKYIDVGVSFRPTLNSFFKSWKADSYPIIFAPPYIKPDIRLAPFNSSKIIVYSEDIVKIEPGYMQKYFGEQHTILPSATSCLQAILKHININKNDTIAVYGSLSGNQYMDKATIGLINNVSKVASSIEPTTKAVIVVHEFGFPYQDIHTLKKLCEQKNIPMIEDCTWGYGSSFNEHTKIGDVGDFAIFSLPHILPMQYGGVLKGLRISDEENWTMYKTLDFFKRELIYTALGRYLPNIEEYNLAKIHNYKLLENYFRREGYEVRTLLPGTIPGAFLVKMDNYAQVHERYTEFGVETIKLESEGSLCLPVNQSLQEGELKYIYAVFRGLLNLCIGYSRGKE